MMRDYSSEGIPHLTVKCEDDLIGFGSFTTTPLLEDRRGLLLLEELRYMYEYSYLR